LCKVKLFVLIVTIWLPIFAEEKSKNFSLTIGENFQTDVENVFGNLDSFRIHKGFESVDEFEKNILLNEKVGSENPALLPTKENFLKIWEEIVSKDYQKVVIYASMKGALDPILGIPYLEFSNREKIYVTELLKQVKNSHVKFYFFLDICLNRSTFYQEKIDEKEDKEEVKLQSINKNFFILLSSNKEGKCFLNENVSGSIFTNLILNLLSEKNKKKYILSNLVTQIQLNWEKFQTENHFTKPYKFFSWNEKQNSTLFKKNFSLPLVRLVPYAKENSYYLSSILYDENKERYYQVNYKNTYSQLVHIVEDGVCEIYHKTRSGFWESVEFLKENQLNRYFGWNEQKEKIYTLWHFHEGKYAQTKYTLEKDKLILTRESSGINLLKDQISWIEYRISRGFVILKSYFLRKDVYAQNSQGISVVRCNYDERGNLLSEEFYDKNKKLIENKEKIAKYFYEYGSSGNLDSVRMYNKSETYISHKPARILNKYNSDGKILSIDYLNFQEQPTTNHIGIQRVEYSYLENGNLEQIKFFGVKNTLYKNGTAFITFSYDKEGNLLKKEFWDAWKRRVNDENGISIYKYFYDSKNRLIATEFFDLAEQETLHPNGYYKVSYQYNLEGLLEKETYFFNDETKENLSQRVQTLVYWYDKQNQLRGKEYYNLLGHLINAEYKKEFTNVLILDSTESIVIKFDKFYRPVELKFFDFSKFISGAE